MSNHNQGLWNFSAQNFGKAADIISNANTNKKQRKWNKEDYRQRKLDAEELWNKNEEYNRPTYQMARLKAAGLNPNLIYGSGGGQTQAPAPIQAELKSTEFRPMPEVSGLAAGYMDATQNRVQNRQTEAQIKQIESMTLLNLSKTDTSDYNLGQLQAHQRQVDALLTEQSFQAANASTISSQNALQAIDKTWQSGMDKIERQYGKSNRDMFEQTHDATIAKIKAETSLAEQKKTIGQFEVEYLKLIQQFAGKGGPAFQTAVKGLFLKLTK